MTSLMSSEFANLMVKPLKAFNKDIQYPVEVRSAGFMGDGVFATQDIKKGTVCCYYDGVFVNSETEAMFVTGKRGYSQFVTGGKTQLMAGFPAEFRKGGCSQMINDYNINYKQRDAPTDGQLKNNKYARGINVITCPDCPAYRGTPVTIAIRDIKKDEQLFSSYGEKYWDYEKNAAKNFGCKLFELTVGQVMRDGLENSQNNWSDTMIDRLMSMFMLDKFDFDSVRHRWVGFQKIFCGRVSQTDGHGNATPLIGTPTY